MKLFLVFAEVIDELGLVKIAAVVRVRFPEKVLNQQNSFNFNLIIIIFWIIYDKNNNKTRLYFFMDGFCVLNLQLCCWLFACYWPQEEGLLLPHNYEYKIFT